MKHPLGVAVVVFVSILLPAPASASYYLQVVNNYKYPVGATVPVGTGGSYSTRTTTALGNAAVAIPGQGIVTFQDTGDTWQCVDMHWSIWVQYAGKSWGVFYDGAPTIVLTINPDATISLSGGVVFANVAPPSCAFAAAPEGAKP